MWKSRRNIWILQKTTPRGFQCPHMVTVFIQVPANLLLWCLSRSRPTFCCGHGFLLKVPADLCNPVRDPSLRFAPQSWFPSLPWSCGGGCSVPQGSSICPSIDTWGTHLYYTLIFFFFFFFFLGMWKSRRNIWILQKTTPRGHLLWPP